VKTDLFDYDLPESAIATEPQERRDGARLCILESDGVRDSRVERLPELLTERDLLVINETKVRAARARCIKPKVGPSGGGQVELLFLRALPDASWEVMTRSGSKLGEGDTILWPEAGISFRILSRFPGGTALVRSTGDVEAALDRLGEMPLPPYMKRKAKAIDRDRYQTVFAREMGSAAAPTAGLHLTEKMLAEVEGRGAQVGRVVLHVGLGTFRPVSVSDLDEHPMHEEWYSVSDELVRQVSEAGRRGGRVVAVGTTVVRALESAAASGELSAGSGMTRLLIQPGYEFRVIDALLTNFHQPRSTLLALVSAFAGRDRVLAAYKWALEQGYHFLSYGDAMWIPGRIAS
jgi:S-adenosylmethionine:tRNA ribosyltransferase-isomerase